jgi:hypothetical protein
MHIIYHKFGTRLIKGGKAPQRFGFSTIIPQAMMVMPIDPEILDTLSLLR